ncbi:hypothetical protein Cylst_6640 (plasmid) [Cylindrospermum stagnale PCC 7417]|uniref:eCIS core domain-containing protein n=1 Tax=Cylindrospermum stagnale PCC 7417 TaxID=56107 RepID=K9X9T1_9NOST|nr:DUF4157 domain-containing protein [Cylindrospermum stagnale]AFZ28407.1 hypothetical protein Cylst_6640 [Cylindrospermum stagnale PCC 7417]
MYSGQHRTSKKSSNSSDTPAPNRFAPRGFVVQPKTEEVAPQQEQTPAKEAQQEETEQYKSGLIDFSKLTPRPSPAKTPRIQMKLTRLQPGEMYQQQPVPSNPIAIQPKANTDLSPAQNTTLEPFEKAEEVGNEAVEIQRLSESGDNGDEDANSPNGGTIQRACSLCDSEKSLLQTKLTIGAPGDKYEQEADSMAEQVMSMDTPTVQQQSIQRQGEELSESIQKQPLSASITPLVQRFAQAKVQAKSNKESLFKNKESYLETTQLNALQAKHISTLNISPGTQAKWLNKHVHTEKPTAQEQPIQRLTDETLQRSVQGDATPATPSLESRLGSQKGSGSPLDEQTRSFMEPRFGSDLSSVRVHTDSTAIQMNKELGAQAFTHGHHIFYGAGKTPGQNALTAHELTHTIQQTGGVQLRRQPEKDNKQPRLTQKYPHPTGTVIQNKLTTGIQPRIQRKTDPGQILEQLKNTPPSNAATAYDTAQANSATAWSEQKQELEASIPQIPAPTGLPAKNSLVKQTPQTAGKADTNKEPLLPKGEKVPVAPNRTSQSDANVQIAPPRPITPTQIAGGNTAKTGETADSKPDVQIAASAQNALNSVNLDSSQISTQAGTAPTVNLTDAAINPAQLDSEQQTANQQVQQQKAKSAQEINKDYGENDIFPKSSDETIKANKQLTLAEVPGAKGGKQPTIPPEIAANLDQSLAPQFQQRIGGEQEKYIVGKNKFDQDTAKSRTDADTEIAKLNQDTSQQQLESQKQAQSDVKSAKLEWQTELDNADKDYQDKAGKATTDQKSKIDAEKLKADAEAAKHLADAEKEAEQKKQTAETEAQQKKDEGQKKSGGFLGWLADQAAALIDGIKQAVSFIYDKLREGIKFIFEAAKKLAIAAIELAQKAITTLIQAYGEILKGIVNLVFAAFPEIAKRINNKIDQAVNTAVQAVNTAADLLKKGVAAALDFLANTLDSLLKLVQDIYNGIFTVIGMIIRGEFGELIKNLTNLVEAAAAAPPQFETAGLEELLGGNLDEPLSPAELAQAGIAAPGANGGAMGEGGTNAELPQAPWTQENVGVDAVENNMQLSPELMAELMQQTKGEGEVELGASNDASRTMEAIMSEATGGKEGESKEGEVQEQKNPDDGLSPKQRAEVRWNLMKTGISQWWSNNWPTVLVGTTAAIGGFIALNVATGGAITAALPAIMSVVGPLFAGVTIAQIGGHIRDYLAKGWAGDIQGGGKSLAKGLAAGAIELVSYLTFKAGDVALKGAKAVVKGAKATVKGGVKLAKGAMNLVAKGAKFIIEKGKVLFKGIAGTALGKGFKRLKELGAALLERMRFKKFRIRVENQLALLEGHINPWVPIAKFPLPKEGKELFSDITKKGQQKTQILFENSSDAKNFARKQLGASAERIYNDSGKWIGWQNKAGDSVYWGHGDWGKGVGLSTYPHLNYNIEGVKGHFFLKDKLINRAMWDDFAKDIQGAINKLPRS